MLEGELDGHLDYKRNAPRVATPVTVIPKKVRTSFGESEISFPRDRDVSFNPMVVPKRGNMVDGIVFKVRESSKVIDKTVYVAVGLRRDGKKEVHQEQAFPPER